MIPLKGILSFLPVGAAVLLLVSASVHAQSLKPDANWDDVVSQAQGQTVYFNAWGGSERISQYLQWAADELQEEYAVTLKHVKVGDTAEVAGQLDAASLAGRDEDGNVDLMWVNGENFASLRDKGQLWGYLAQLHPKLLGAGKSWPANAEATRQLLDNGELDIALSFNPNEASAAVRSDQLPDTARTYVFDDGTIGNTHFATIPWNATARAGAMVAANFLLSPEAQARKADPEYWGDPMVLDLSLMDEEQRVMFESIDRGIWSLPLGEGEVLSEPHASWTRALENAWVARHTQ